MKFLKNRGFLAVALALVAGVLGNPQAQAATLVSAQGNATGNGTFYLNNGRGDRVRTVLVNLGQTRNFLLRFTPSNTRNITIAGTWRGSSNETVTLDINRGPDGRAARGRGTITFQRRNGKYLPDRIEFNSSTTGNKSITCRLNFDASGAQDFTSSWSGGGNGGGGGNNGQIEQLFSTKNGSGRVEVSGQRDTNVRRAKVELNRNGEALIELTGQKAWIFEGRWTVTRGNTVRISLDSASSARSNSRWLGDGEITLTRNAFDRINLNGKLGSDRFTATFNAN